MANILSALIINILSTLLDNGARFNEILKEQTSEMDGTCNFSIFCDKFEEKLSEVVTSKQNSEFLFTIHILKENKIV